LFDKGRSNVVCKGKIHGCGVSVCDAIARGRSTALSGLARRWRLGGSNGHSRVTATPAISQAVSVSARHIQVDRRVR
jgi:hypothetical protein